MPSAAGKLFRLVCLPLLLLPVAAFAAPKAAFYVAPNGNDAWSGKLPAPNAARTDGPFATPAAAQQAVRKMLNGKAPAQPLTVLLRGGVYRLAQPLVFTPEDSGTDADPITYAAYPGEKPVLAGSRRVSGFRQVGKLWKSSVPGVKAGQWYFQELFINGKRRQRARTPNQGYFYAAGYVPPQKGPDGKYGEPSHTAFYYGGTDLKPWKRLEDAVVTVYHSWETSLHHIKSLDSKRRLVTFTGPANWYFGYWGPKQRYVVENIAEALDAPGEWFLNRETGELSYYPLPGEKLSSTVAEAPATTELLRFDGNADQGRLVRDIRFRGIAFRYADWKLEPGGHSDPQAVCTLPATIMMTGAEDCRLEECELSHLGAYGVWIGRGSKACRVVKCHLFDLGAGGVRIGETKIPDNETIAGGSNVVDNNYIHDYGEVYAAGVGVYIAHSSNNQVTHNEIHDGYYTGISVGWDWGHAPTHAQNNLIAFNHIHHLMKGVLSDGGGIYTLGTSPGTVIRNNRIHDIFSYKQPLLAWGIYLDAQSNQILVENNLCYNLQNGGLMHHNGAFENIIRNNIFARSSNELVWRALPVGGPNVFERNICYVTQGNLFLLDPVPDVKSRWNRNLYWRTGGKDLAFNGETLAEWRQRGFDQESVVADPQFVNPAKDDFRLKPSSPAIQKLGFQPFDISACGLYGDPAWVRLPRQARFAKTVLPPPPPGQDPRPVVTSFEREPVTARPEGPVCSLGEGGIIAVTGERAATGKHALKIAENGGLKNVWDPHVYYQPHFRKLTARVSFKLYLGEGALPVFEWRDGSYPYHVGPSFKVDEKDQLVAGAQKLIQVPRGEWISLTVECPLGDKADGYYDLTVTLPGQQPRAFCGLPCDPAFKRLEWLGFISMAGGKSSFYLDDLNIKTVK